MPKKISLAVFLLTATLGWVATPVVMADEADDDQGETPLPPPRPQPPPPPPPAPPPPPRYEPPPPPPRAEVLPPVEEPSDWDSGWSLDVEPLWLRFASPDFDFAATGPVGGPFDLDSTDSSHSFGGRLGVGYRWRNRWDVMFHGTHIDHDDSDFADDSKGDLLTVRSAVNTFADEALGRMDTELNYVDGEAGYTWGRQNRSNVRIFFGLRVSQFDQDADVLYDGADANLDLVELDNSVDAWGGRFGVEGRVYMGSGWSFIARGGVAVLDADFDIDRFETEPAGTTVVADFSDNFSDTIVALEGQIGFGWMHESDDWAFGVEFGAEAQRWDDMARLVHLNPGPGGFDDVFDDDRHDDVELDGAFVRFRFLF